MIKYYNRYKSKYEFEKVAGDSYLNWIYSSPVGMTLLEIIVKRKLFSSLYGLYCSSRLSKKKISSFIKDFNINMEIYDKKSEEYDSFNDFFYRKLKSGRRNVDLNVESFVSPADGKLSAYYNIDMENLVQVKGITYSLNELIGDKKTSETYNGGTCLVFRLCPTDYHRFHFVDNGSCGEAVKIKGSYYSVNPVALKAINKLFCENKREWSIFHSENFDDILYVEVGATCVGSIIQSYKSNSPVKKGEEKGYFKFGGSTVILFLKKGTVTIEEELFNQTLLGYETAVQMGEIIGRKIQKL